MAMMMMTAMNLFVLHQRYAHQCYAQYLNSVQRLLFLIFFQLLIYYQENWQLDGEKKQIREMLLLFGKIIGFCN